MSIEPTMWSKYIRKFTEEEDLVPGTGLLCLEHSSAAAGWAKPEAMDGRAHRTNNGTEKSQ